MLIRQTTELVRRTGKLPKAVVLAGAVAATLSAMPSAFAADSPVLIVKVVNGNTFVSGRGFEAGSDVAILATATTGSTKSTIHSSQSGRVAFILEPIDGFTGPLKLTVGSGSSAVTKQVQIGASATASATASSSSGPAKLGVASSAKTSTKESTSSKSSNSSLGSTSDNKASKTTSSGDDGSASASETKSSAAKSATGDAFDKGWGDVQVKVTMSGDKITKVEVPVYDHNGHSGGINNNAIPKLIEAAQSSGVSGISTISGATVTTEAFKASLESAIAKAKSA